MTRFAHFVKLFFDIIIFTHAHPAQTTIQEQIMDTDRPFGLQFLERIRAEIDEIQKILVLYTTQGKLDVDALPELIVCFRHENHASVVKTLQQRYHILQGQEVDLVLATKDKAAITELLIRIRALVHEIEKVMFKARPFQLLSLPLCLSSCRSSGTSLTAPALLERCNTLKQHEFRIALADMQANTSQSSTSLVDHTLASESYYLASSSSALASKPNDFSSGVQLGCGFDIKVTSFAPCVFSCSHSIQCLSTFELAHIFGLVINDTGNRPWISMRQLHTFLKTIRKENV